MRLGMGFLFLQINSKRLISYPNSSNLLVD